MRYFIDLSYCGTRFNGWQSQRKQGTSRCVQTVMEQALTTLTKSRHEIVGCGRTDTGVHARHFVAHTDSEFLLSDSIFVDKLNRFLPEDVVVHDIYAVNDTAHARFDAVSRSYVYYIHLLKSPFPELSFYYPFHRPSLQKLNEAASLLLSYNDFFPFCKTKTDVKTTLCDIRYAEWIQKEENKLEFHITGDRFLRGMVRLIVGMCLDADRGKISLEQVTKAIETRSTLPRSWSVPAIGLFLHKIEYPPHVKIML